VSSLVVLWAEGTTLLGSSHRRRTRQDLSSRSGSPTPRHHTGLRYTLANGRLLRGYLIGFAMRLVGGSPLPLLRRWLHRLIASRGGTELPSGVLFPYRLREFGLLPAQDRRVATSLARRGARGDASARAWSLAALHASLCAAPHLRVRLALGSMHSLPEGGYSLAGMCGHIFPPTRCYSLSSFNGAYWQVSALFWLLLARAV
jgi:hypothetical protein